MAGLTRAQLLQAVSHDFDGQVTEVFACRGNEIYLKVTVEDCTEGNTNQSAVWERTLPRREYDYAANPEPIEEIRREMLELAYYHFMDRCGFRP